MVKKMEENNQQTKDTIAAILDAFQARVRQIKDHKQKIADSIRMRLLKKEIDTDS